MSIVGMVPIVSNQCLFRAIRVIIALADPCLSVSMLIEFLDLVGTAAFAATGAFKAVEHRADVVGVIILATITGVAGGVLRDVIFGRIPPVAIANPLYVAITIGVAVAIFFLYRSFKHYEGVILKFDAVGLGVFTIIGASFAYSMFGLNFLAMAFAGMVTAVGGGILRDVFVNEVPIVFVKELYASASFAGVAAFFGMLAFGIEVSVAAVPCIALVTGLRMLAIKRNWNLPRSRL